MENLRTPTLAARKKTIFVLFFIINCIFTDCFAQSITWQWLYPKFYDLDDYGYGICASTDENYFLAGVSRGVNFPNNYSVFKINPQGLIVWSKSIGESSGSGIAFCIAPTSEGGCVATGDAARFLKLSKNGDLLVNRIINDGNERRLYSIKHTSDNNYITCGRYNLDNATIIKFDSLGSVIWEKKFLSTYHNALYDIDVCTNGGYITVGRNQNYFGDPIKLLIIRIEENGDTLWKKEYGNNKDGLSICRDNLNYIICGQREVTKIDENGNVFNSFPIDSIRLTERAEMLKLINPNRYIYHTTDDLDPDSIYSKILLSDSTGRILISKKINFSNIVDLNSTLITSNSDIIFMGYATYNNTHTRTQFYALRTDSLFNFPTVSIIGNILNEIYVPKNFSLHQNYPNPFNPVTTIKYDLPVNSVIKIRIYGLLGKEIFSVNEYKSAGSYEVMFDGSGYASGVFFYSLEANGFLETKKMVLVK